MKLNKAVKKYRFLVYNIVWLNNLIIVVKLFAKFSRDSKVYKTEGEQYDN